MHFLRDRLRWPISFYNDLAAADRAVVLVTLVLVAAIAAVTSASMQLAVPPVRP